MSNSDQVQTQTQITKTKSIQFYVPISYQVPEELQRAQEEDAATLAAALDLAAHAFQSLRSKSSQIQNEALFQELKEQATKDYDSRLKKLKQQAEESDATQAILRKQLAELQTILTQTRQEERDRARELLADKDSQITELRSQLRESSARLLDGFQTLRHDWTKYSAQIQATSNNSSIKGRLAEQTLADLLVQVYGNVPNGEEFTVTTKAKEAYTSDIHMAWMKGAILWESKNYKDTVNTKEVQKFLRDLELNKEMSLGVMVSFQSGIQGHTKAGNLDLEVLPDGRLAIYVSNLADNDPVQVLQGLRPFLEIFIQFDRQRISKSLANPQDSAREEAEHLRRKHSVLESSLGILTVMCNKHIKTLTESRNRINIWQKKQAQMFAELHTDIREQEQYAKQILEEILGTVKKFQGNEEEILAADSGVPVQSQLDTLAISQASNPHFLPPSLQQHSIQLDTLVFTHQSLSEYDGKEQRFIQDILKIAEIKEDAKILAKDIKDPLLKKNWTLDSINHIRSQVFQPGVWDSGSKYIRHLIIKQTDAA